METTFMEDLREQCHVSPTDQLREGAAAPGHASSAQICFEGTKCFHLWLPKIAPGIEYKASSTGPGRLWLNVSGV